MTDFPHMTAIVEESSFQTESPNMEEPNSQNLESSGDSIKSDHTDSKNSKISEKSGISMDPERVQILINDFPAHSEGKLKIGVK